MYYGYTKSSVPAVIPAGGGLAPMGGPFYDYDPDLDSDVKFPEYFDGKPFFYEWSKNRIYSMTLDGDGHEAREDLPLPADRVVPVAAGHEVRPRRRAVHAGVGRRLRP